MGASAQDKGDQMARMERAFQLVVIEHKSLRAAAAELGVSHQTVSNDVSAYKAFLASARRGEDVEQRRATIEQMLTDVQRRAIVLHDKAMDAGNTLHATAALNTIVSTIGHLRAITGADTPKQVEQKQEGEITIKWQE